MNRVRKTTRSGERRADPSLRRFGPLPSLESLRCFHAGATHLNFRRAAASVGLTAAAFSERIRSLESEIGTELFVRTTRRVELTPSGQALLPAALDALQSAQRCLDVAKASEGRVVKLRLGTRFELGLSWVLPAVMDLERERSILRVDLYFGSGPDILDRLGRGLLDAVVTSAPVARADWDAHPLHVETYELVGARQLLARAPFETPADARRHVLFDVDSELPLGRYLLSVVPKLKFAETRACGAGAAVLARVVAAEGVAVLPTYMVANALRTGELVRLLPSFEPLTDTFRLMFRKDTPLAGALEELVAHLRSRPLT